MSLFRRRLMMNQNYIDSFPSIEGLIARYSARGLTNEQLSQNPILKDLSGNGHDITLHNFAWSGMSGVGGYVQTEMVRLFATNDSSIGSSELLDPNKIKYTFLQDPDNKFGPGSLPTYCNSFSRYYANKSWKIKMESNVPDLELELTFFGDYNESGDRIVVRRYTLKVGQVITIDQFTDEEIALIQYEGNLDHQPETKISSGTMIPGDWFTLEEVSQFPNALVSDGVDDYGICENFPILTKEEGYTVVAIRKWLNTNIDYAAFLSKDQRGSNKCEFVVERKSLAYFYTINFSNINNINSIINTDFDIVYQTSKKYNNTQINIGDSPGTDYLAVFCNNASNQFSSIALYDLLIYDRDLTEEEIGKLKRWLMYQQEHPEDTTSDWYGVEWYTDDSQSSVRRIGNVNLHKSLPIQSGMYRCILNDNGEEVYKLDPNDSTKKEDGTAAVLDGTDGQVMVCIPVFYAKFETQGYRRRVMLSSRSKSGFKKMGGCYVSAYESAIDRTTSDTPKLASVVNTTANFRGGNNNSEWDNTYRSLLGMPATVTSLTNFRAYARNRNNGDTKWNCMDYTAYKAIYWLYIVEYADRNCQIDFNDELTAEGYRQGGLGAGVTNINSSKLNAFNGYYPFIPCGYTNSLGNKTGVVAFTMPDEYDAETPLTTYVPSYRGIENPFGHIWKWTDGIHIKVQSEEAGGKSILYTSDNPANYQDTSYEGYQEKGYVARENGYVKDILFGEEGDMIVKEGGATGASSTTYLSDHFYTNIPTSREALRGVLFGGSANHGTYAGLVYASSTYAPSATTAYFGSRLCYIPNNNNN